MFEAMPQRQFHNICSRGGVIFYECHMYLEIDMKGSRIIVHYSRTHMLHSNMKYGSHFLRCKRGVGKGLGEKDSRLALVVPHSSRYNCIIFHSFFDPLEKLV